MNDIFEIKIGNKFIGDNYPTYFIVEVGSNHNGDIETAKKYILSAKDIGADAVKFQAFTADTLVNKRKLPDIYRLMDGLEMPLEWIPELASFCNEVGIEFICSPFNRESVDILEKAGVNAYKVASGEITNLPLLNYISSKKKPVLLSTGMCDLSDINEAIKTLNQNGCYEIIILHCISKYPPKYDEMNIKTIQTLKDAFKYTVGFSDHSEDDIGTLASITLGAKVIEKHITFSKDSPGPDHSFALTVNQFRDMIINVRKLEMVLGTTQKKATMQEVEGPLNRARRSIYASKKIEKNTVITENMLTILRPVIGIEPKYLDIIIGRKAKVDIEAYDEITWDKV